MPLLLEHAVSKALTRQKRSFHIIHEYATRLQETASTHNPQDFRRIVEGHIEQMWLNLDVDSIAQELLIVYEGDIEDQLELLREQDPEWQQARAEYYKDHHKD